MALSAQDRETLRYQAFLASAAYCSTEALKNWDCGRRCRKTRGVKFLKAFSNPVTEISSFLATIEEQRQIVISFRGSETLVNWLNNLRIQKESIPWKHKGEDGDPRVHKGFLEDYESVAEFIISYVKELLASETYEAYTVVATGHSLGAALATLCAAGLRHELPSTVNTHLVGYESPRVGNADFALLVQPLFPPARRARVTHGSDMAVHVPPYLIGFRHPGREVFLNGSIGVWCAENDEDPQCANAYMPDSLSDHLWYGTWKVRFGIPCEP